MIDYPVSARLPIGVFDSGVGGLTAVRAVQSLMPSESVVFLGDTARVPYGSRSPETIHQFARQNMDFLLRFHVKAVLAACGTVSSIALSDLQDEGIPVCGVLQPAVERAAALTRSGRVGVIATAASIRNGSFQRALESRGCTAFPAACPDYVLMAERGQVRPDDPAVRAVTAEYLSGIRDAGVDCLILGCTHFPLFSDAIAEFMGPEVRLINSSLEAAAVLAARIRENGSAAEGGSGTLQCWVTGEAAPFAPLARRFLGTDEAVSIRHTDHLEGGKTV